DREQNAPANARSVVGGDLGSTTLATRCAGGPRMPTPRPVKRRLRTRARPAGSHPQAARLEGLQAGGSSPGPALAHGCPPAAAHGGAAHGATGLPQRAQRASDSKRAVVGSSSCTPITVPSDACAPDVAGSARILMMRVGDTQTNQLLSLPALPALD